MPGQEVTVVIIGAGSVLWSPLIARDLRLNKLIKGKIVLYDRDLAAARRALLLYKRYHTDGRWTIEAALTLEQALKGADFVIFTINNFGLAGTKIDLEVPAKHGIVQTVGDTVSAGGLSRAIRNIPAIVEVARAMAKICPRAWLLNCSNPMTVLCMAAEHILPGRVIGYCHEWPYYAKYLRGLGLGVGKRWRPVIFGINHLAAALDLFEIDDGVRSASVLDQVISALPELTMSDEKYAAVSSFDNHRQLSRLMALQQGMLIFPGDRHIAEFLSGCSMHPDWLRQMLIKITTFDDRDKGAIKAREQYQHWLDETEPLPSGHSSEELDHIIVALAGFQDYETNLLTRPLGQLRTDLIETLRMPDGIMLEVSCYVSQDRVSPVNDLRAALLAGPGRRTSFFDLTRTHAFNCIHTYLGVRDGRKDWLVDVIENDPSASYQLVESGGDVEALVGKLIDDNCALIGVPSWA